MIHIQLSSAGSFPPAPAHTLHLCKPPIIPSVLASTLPIFFFLLLLSIILKEATEVKSWWLAELFRVPEDERVDGVICEPPENVSHLLLLKGRNVALFIPSRGHVPLPVITLRHGACLLASFSFSCLVAGLGYSL